MSGSSGAAPTADAKATCSPVPDLMEVFRQRILQMMLDFGDQVLDAVRDAKRIDVEDVRTRLLGPMRQALECPESTL